VTETFQRSQAQFERAKRSLAGGVATAFRAAQQPVPVCFTGGRGARLTDLDGREYVDYALGFGPMILGHSPRPVLEAVRRQLDRGLGYGASHDLEAELAEAVCRTVPSAELCAFGSTGSEAVATALRIARAATGRNQVIKFLGHYDGWHDSVHVGVPGQRAKAPGTAGQDPGASAATTVIGWNDADALAVALGDHDVAAVLMEPAAINCGALAPAPGYLERARDLTTRAGAVLIFDEVITGYRLALGGAQERYGVAPDLTVLGKAIGAGFPLSAVCGRREVMDVVAQGQVAHVGTFNANPVCAAAALAAIRELERDPGLYQRLGNLGAQLAGILREEAGAAGLPLVVNQIGAAAHGFMSATPVNTYEDTLRADPAGYRRFARALLQERVQVIPRGLLYVSSAHTDEDLEVTRAAARKAAVTAATAAADDLCAVRQRRGHLHRRRIPSQLSGRARLTPRS
jgi:glutamate-1-semialdehyde 2,1-aminomutase